MRWYLLLKRKIFLRLILQSLERLKLKNIIRIHKGKSKTLITHKVHVDLFDNLKQVGMHLENIAKTIANTSPFKSILDDNNIDDNENKTEDNLT